VGRVHTYRTTLSWDGSTGVGYDDYSRAHQVQASPAAAALALSSDPAFRGDPSSLNPEQLLVAAASSCQLLSFLAVAARARLDVVSYRDVADAVMPEDDAPVRITRIDLRPHVVLADTGAARPTPDRLAHLTEVAHRECFIANSLTTEVVVFPTFSWSGTTETRSPA
jgi:organic hydroperoxide reductase OsmC/OhrA